MLAAHLLHRSVAAEPGQHDLDLLLRRPTPVLPLLAHPDLLSVEQPILSRPPDSLSGATPLRDRPADQPAGRQHGTGEQGRVRQAEADSGRRRDLLSSEEREELKRLRKENQQLRRANEILKDASVFFATELDPSRRR